MMSGSRPLRRIATIAAFWMLAAALAVSHTCLQYMVAAGGTPARLLNRHGGANQYHKAQQQVRRNSVVAQTAEASGSTDVDAGAKVRDVMQMATMPALSGIGGVPMLACVGVVSALCLGFHSHGQVQKVARATKAPPLFGQTFQKLRSSLGQAMPHQQKKTEINQKQLFDAMTLTVPLFGAAIARKESENQNEKIDSLDALFEPQTAVIAVA